MDHYLGLLDLANKNTRYPDMFEFQINKEWFLVIRTYLRYKFFHCLLDIQI